jgi:neutral ceramidase
LKTREGVVWAPNYLGEIDRQLIVLRFVNHEGHTRGVIFNCACHPSGLNFDNYLLSAEFPGYACKKIEAEYEGATAIFLQGCAGEIKPIQCVNARKDGFKSYSFEECEEAGLELAGDVLRIMNDGEFDKIDYNERTVISDLRIYSHVWSHEMLKAHRRWIQESPELNRRLRETMDALRKGAPKYFIQCYVCVWDLGNGFRIITIEGEPESRLGKKIKEFIGEDTTMVLGYSNGVQTYINSIETQREGNSYERDSFLEINLSGPIVEEAEYILLGYVGEVARNLNWPGSR